MNKDVFKISELNQFIKDVINSGFPQALWICGEIQGYNRSKNKTHVFFDLVEKKEGTPEIVAKIGLVIFGGKKAYIEQVLKKNQNPFELKDDIEVKFACRIDFYAPHGVVRLIVEDIDPTYTVGKLAIEKQKLIAQLKAKGIFDRNKQLEFPTVALNIGLITSDESAAFNDFRSELNASGYGFKIFLRNTLMQGKKAEKDVCDALDELSKVRNLDIIVITRGGGSISDLSDFDSQLIAEKIAACPLPVLSGIGHEIDITITDMTAHTYAKTPTAIAQFLVLKVQNFIDTLDSHLSKILDLSESQIQDQKQKLKEISYNLQHHTLEFIRQHNEQLIGYSEFIKNKPIQLMRELKTALDYQKEELLKNISIRIKNEQQKLSNQEKIIDILNPINTMKRGFSITRFKTGKIVRSNKEVKKNDLLVTQLMDGYITSQIETIEGDKSG